MTLGAVYPLAIVLSDAILALFLILFGPLPALTIDLVVIEKLLRLERNDSI